MTRLTPGILLSLLLLEPTLKAVDKEPLSRAIAGDGIAIIDPGEAVARELRRRLDSVALLSRGAGKGADYFWTSDCPANAKSLVSQLWEGEVNVNLLPEVYRRS